MRYRGFLSKDHPTLSVLAPTSMTMALSVGVPALWAYPSGCAFCKPLKGNSGAGCILGVGQLPSAGTGGLLLSSMNLLILVIVILADMCSPVLWLCLLWLSKRGHHVFVLNADIHQTPGRMMW